MLCWYTRVSKRGRTGSWRSELRPSAAARDSPDDGGRGRRGRDRGGKRAWPLNPEGASYGRGGPRPPPRAPVRQGASGGAGRGGAGLSAGGGGAPGASSSLPSSASRTPAAAAGRTGVGPAASASLPPPIPCLRVLARHVGGRGVCGLLCRRRAHGHLFGSRGASRATRPRGRGPRCRPGCARHAPRGHAAGDPWGTATASHRSGVGRRHRCAPPAGRQHPGRSERRAGSRHSSQHRGGHLSGLLLLGRFVSVFGPRPRRGQEPPLSLPRLRQSLLQVFAPQVTPADSHR